jgi:hypothetical protein
MSGCAKHYNCEQIVAPISFAEVLLRLEHKFSNAIVGPSPKS